VVDAKVAGSLVGKSILVTRSREQASALSRLLTERGAIPVELPTIEFMPPTDQGPVEAAIGRLADYEWAIFTSVNGVRFFGELLQVRGIEATALHRLHLAAIGPATAAALATLGLNVELVPSTYIAEAVVKEFRRVDLRGKRVLLPRALEARDVLAEGLTAQGAFVDVVPVYQTVVAQNGIAARDTVRGGALTAVTFTSSSTVRNLATLLGEDAVQQLVGIKIATIGPVTSQTARDLGLTVHVEASEHTIPGLVTALERYFEE
jgi:uroporphyrinogen III methyltransferase/synthase